MNIKPKGIYVDLTFGGGGHSLEVLKKLGKKGRLYAFDQDPDAVRNIPKDERLIFIKANFRYLQNFMSYHNVQAVDGILADLGISSYQIDQPERGFSFRTESELDMRMNPEGGMSAVELINEYDKEDLIRIFREYGEIKNAGRIAMALVSAREKELIRTSRQLEEAIEGLVPQHTRSKFLAKLYQAIRIEVNEEVEALKEVLVQTGDLLAPEGRLVVITYHSLEDRLVKNYLKTGNLEGRVEKDFYGNVQSFWKLINRSVIIPSEEELKENNRSRSAKLRIAERI